MLTLPDPLPQQDGRCLVLDDGIPYHQIRAGMELAFLLEQMRRADTLRREALDQLRYGVRIETHCLPQVAEVVVRLGFGLEAILATWRVREACQGTELDRLVGLIKAAEDTLAAGSQDTILGANGGCHVATADGPGPDQEPARGQGVVPELRLAGKDEELYWQAH